VNIVTFYWEEGTSALRETLKVCREAGIAAPLVNTSVSVNVTSPNSSSAIEEEGMITGENTNNNNANSTPPPPRQLLAHPPLARLVNAHLTGLNELRRCLLPDAFPQLRERLNKVILDVKEVLVTNEKKVHTPGFLRGDAVQLREIANVYLEVFQGVLEPYLKLTLDVALGCDVSVVDDEEEDVDGGDVEKDLDGADEDDKGKSEDENDVDGVDVDDAEENDADPESNSNKDQNEVENEERKDVDENVVVTKDEQQQQDDQNQEEE